MTMTHGYTLRPNAKGRQRHQSVDDTDDQVGLDVEAGTVDPRPATPDTPRAAHKSLAPTPHTEDGGHQHSRNITTSSSTTTLTRYRVEGPPETWEEIQAARKRGDAKRFAEAVRIRREQIVRGYDSELGALRARIKALRSECEVQVKRVTRKWERAWAIERGEVGVVVEDGEGGPAVGYSDWEDARGEVAVDEPRTTSHSRPQPLQRRPAELVVVPTLSHGLHMHTYGTAVPDPEIHLGETDGDKDSEMDG